MIAQTTMEYANLLVEIKRHPPLLTVVNLEVVVFPKQQNQPCGFGF
jgi:hypothetical protein